ncbi:MAG: flagellar hook-length control protein FliK [Acetobacteraceae bacterium]
MPVSPLRSGIAISGAVPDEAGAPDGPGASPDELPGLDAAGADPGTRAAGPMPEAEQMPPGPGALPAAQARQARTQADVLARRADGTPDAGQDPVGPMGQAGMMIAVIPDAAATGPLLLASASEDGPPASGDDATGTDAPPPIAAPVLQPGLPPAPGLLAASAGQGAGSRSSVVLGAGSPGARATDRAGAEVGLDAGSAMTPASAAAFALAGEPRAGHVADTVRPTNAASPSPFSPADSLGAQPAPDQPAYPPVAPAEAARSAVTPPVSPAAERDGAHAAAPARTEGGPPAGPEAPVPSTTTGMLLAPADARLPRDGIAPPAGAEAPLRAPAAPADQVAPAIISLARGADGSNRMTLRLDPADLGHVQIRIERPADAPASVEITVDRPETLTLLLRDQTRLEHTLTQAGLPPEGRSVSLQLAPPQASADTAGSSAGHGWSQGAGQFAQDGHGSSDAGRGRGRDGSPGGPAAGETDNIGDARHWLRAGLDITA